MAIEQASRVFKGGIAIAITSRGISGLTGQRKEKGLKLHDRDGEELPEEFYHATRRKLESSDALKKISNALSKLKGARNDAGLEWGEGIWIIPVSKAADVLQKIKEYEAELIESFNDYVDNHYPDDIASAKVKLGKRFRERDYPSQDALKANFSIRIRVVELSVPDTLKKLDASLYKEQVEKANESAKEFMEMSTHTLRTELDEFLSAIRKAVNPGVDGRKGRVSTKVIEKFNLIYSRFKELAFLTDEHGEAFCPKGCQISDEVAAAVADPELEESELPKCHYCGAQLARKTVMNYAYRIKQAMEGNGVPLDKPQAGAAAMRESHTRVLLHSTLSELAQEAEETLELQSSARFIKRRKSRKSSETNE